MFPVWVTLCLWIFVIWLIFVPVVQLITYYKFRDENISAERINAYGKLSTVFMLLIGTQWLAQPIRSSAFQRHVNPSEEAKAKELSTVFMIPIVLLYSILSSIVPRQEHLITYVCTFYGGFFTFMACYLVYLDLYEQQSLYHDHTHADSHTKNRYSDNHRAYGSGAGYDSGYADLFFHPFRWIFSGMMKRFLMYALYILIETKAGICLSMTWSCVHLFFKSSKKSDSSGKESTGGDGESSPQSGDGNTSSGVGISPTTRVSQAMLVYPFLNFWCQIGGTVGALGGVLSAQLQIPVITIADGSPSSHIITGCSMLYFVIGIGTLAIPMFAAPAFRILERENRTDDEEGSNGMMITDETTDGYDGYHASPNATMKRLPPPTTRRGVFTGQIESGFEMEDVLHGGQRSGQPTTTTTRNERMRSPERNRSPRSMSPVRRKTLDFDSPSLNPEILGNRAETTNLLELDEPVSTYYGENQLAKEEDSLLGARQRSFRRQNSPGQQPRSPAGEHHHQQQLRPLVIKKAKMTFSQAALQVAHSSVEGLQIILTTKYVFLIWLCHSGHLGIRTLMELQGSQLVSYIYQYPADDGLNLKGPNAKHTTDARTRLISTMLLLNGVLSALVSLFGTSELMKRWGVRGTLLLNPVMCFSMMILFSFCAWLSEANGYVTIYSEKTGHTLVLSRPYIEWNDDSFLDPRWTIEHGWNAETKYTDSEVQARNFGLGRDWTGQFEGIIHRQGCTYTSELSILFEREKQSSSSTDADHARRNGVDTRSSGRSVESSVRSSSPPVESSRGKGRVAQGGNSFAEIRGSVQKKGSGKKGKISKTIIDLRTSSPSRESDDGDGAKVWHMWRENDDYDSYDNNSNNNEEDVWRTEDDGQQDYDDEKPDGMEQRGEWVNDEGIEDDYGWQNHVGSAKDNDIVDQHRNDNAKEEQQNTRPTTRMTKPSSVLDLAKKRRGSHIPFRSKNAVAFSWRDPLTGRMDTFFQLRELTCKNAEDNLESLRPSHPFYTRFQNMKRHHEEQAQTLKEQKKGLTNTKLEMLAKIRTNGIGASSSPSPDGHYHHEETYAREEIHADASHGNDAALNDAMEHASLNANLLECRQHCSAHFPLCTHVTFDRNQGTCYLYHVNDESDDHDQTSDVVTEQDYSNETSSYRRILDLLKMYNACRTIEDYQRSLSEMGHGLLNLGNGPKDIVRTKSESDNRRLHRKNAGLDSDGRHSVDSYDSQNRYFVKSSEHGSVIGEKCDQHGDCKIDRDRRLASREHIGRENGNPLHFQMIGKCSFHDMVSDAKNIGATAVILVNPGNRRRVERLQRNKMHSQLNTFTVFMSEKEYESTLKQHELDIDLTRHEIHSAIPGKEQQQVRSGNRDQRRDILRAHDSNRGSNHQAGGHYQNEPGDDNDITHYDSVRSRYDGVGSRYRRSVDNGMSFLEGSSLGVLKKRNDSSSGFHLTRIAGTGGGSYSNLPGDDSTVRKGTHYLSFLALFYIVSFCSILTNVVVFAINSPIIEQLYLVTSKTAKVKAKSWISAFGSNLVKALGNRTNTLFNTPNFCPLISSLFSTVWFIGWLHAVIEAGVMHQRKTEEEEEMG